MHRIYRYAVLLSALLLGCATTESPAPQGDTGPTARIGEHAFKEDNTKAQIFYIASIDGKPVISTIHATRMASGGMGFSVAIRYVEHTVPARPLRLKLVGTHFTGAPIHEIASRAAGTFHHVEGEIHFTPEPGGYYYVTGKLQKEGSSVWLADANTERRVSEVVTERK